MSNVLRFLHPVREVRIRVKLRNERIQRELKSFAPILETDKSGRLRPVLTESASKHVESKYDFLKVEQEYGNLKHQNTCIKYHHGIAVVSGFLPTLLLTMAGCFATAVYNRIQSTGGRVTGAVLGALTGAVLTLTITSSLPI